MDRKYIIMIIVALVVILLICGMVLFPSLKKKLEEKKDIETRESWQQEEAHTSDIEVKKTFAKPKSFVTSQPVIVIVCSKES